MRKHASMPIHSPTHTVFSKVSGPLRKTSPLSLNQPVDFEFAHISRLALALESDRSRIEEWYRAEQIRELGGLTAQQLVRQGNADLVISFLRSIRRGERD